MPDSQNSLFNLNAANILLASTFLLSFLNYIKQEMDGNLYSGSRIYKRIVYLFGIGIPSVGLMIIACYIAYANGLDADIWLFRGAVTLFSILLFCMLLVLLTFPIEEHEEKKTIRELLDDAFRRGGK